MIGVAPGRFARNLVVNGIIETSVSLRRKVSHLRLLVLLAFSLVLAAPQAFAQTPELKSTISKSKTRDGKTVKVETFRLSADQVRLGALTISQRYYVWDRFPDHSNEPFDVMMACVILSTGYVDSHCIGADDNSAPGGENAGTKFVLFSEPEFPSFREISFPESQKMSRRIVFPIRLDPATKPIIDWEAGEIVEFSAFQFHKRMPIASYPSRALQRSIEGVMTMECQVQNDLSLICRSDTFEPAEHFQLFASVPERQSAGVTLKPQLLGGGSAIGARAKIVVRFRMGD